MATTIKREGKEKRPLSSLPAATPAKDAAPRLQRSSSSSSSSSSSRAKRIPTATATHVSRPLSRIRSPEGHPTNQKKTLSPPSSSTAKRAEEVATGTSRRQNPAGRAAGAPTKPKPRGAAAIVPTTSPRPKPAVVAPKPKAERAVKQHQPKAPTRGRSPNNSNKDSSFSSSSHSSSSPIPDAVPEEHVIVPVIPENVVVVNADAGAGQEFDHQCLLDSTQLEDDQIPDLPDPEREKEPDGNAEEEPDIKTEIAIDHDDEVQQQMGNEEKDAEAAAHKDSAAAVTVRRQAKETVPYNDVIEETRSRLAERKSKVLALVGAFETVISLQEPETPVPAHAPPAQANHQVHHATVAVDGDHSADEPTSPPTFTTAAT